MLLVRGWLVQIVQEGGEAPLRNHVSLKGEVRTVGKNFRNHQP